MKIRQLPGALPPGPTWGFKAAPRPLAFYHAPPPVQKFLDPPLRSIAIRTKNLQKVLNFQKVISFLRTDATFLNNI
jgi:hypothetical protein